MFLTVTQPSTCVNSLQVEPLNSNALVEYKNGDKYLYSQVEFGALYDLIWAQTDSIGTWVINNLKNAPGVQCIKL